MLRVGFDTLIFMLLALGLNTVVGYAGLLDLGYVAFFGFGAYIYAMLASDQFGLHWPTPVILIIVVPATILLGLLVGLPSRRLVGDYLAIVTLFFGQLFVTVANNGNRISILGFTHGFNITNGPNGITNIDAFHLFGHYLESLRSYYWVALLFFLAVFATVYLVSNSRTGRAWRSLREDSLAAEMMGMPVNRLKLYAFAFGAGIAGLTGTLFASLQTGVYSSDFDTPHPDHDLRDRDPRRGRQPRRDDPRRDRRQRLARGAANPEPRDMGLLHPDHRDAAREAAPLEGARGRVRRDDRVRVRGLRRDHCDLADRERRHRRGHRRARTGARALGADPGRPDEGGQLGLRRARRARSSS